MSLSLVGFTFFSPEKSRSQRKSAVRASSLKGFPSENWLLEPKERDLRALNGPEILTPLDHFKNYSLKIRTS
jgi:hypothetical protein